MLIASRLRLPYRSASQGQRYRPTMPTSMEICTPVRYSPRPTANSCMTSGATSAKIAPSMPSNPQPRPFAQAMCQWVEVSRPSGCAAFRYAAERMCRSSSGPPATNGGDGSTNAPAGAPAVVLLIPFLLPAGEFGEPRRGRAPEGAGRATVSAAPMRPQPMPGWRD